MTAFCGASAGNPIQRNQDYGVEAGGPIMKGRLWFWGAVARTDVKVGVNNFFTGSANAEPEIMRPATKTARLYFPTFIPVLPVCDLLK